MLPCKCGVRHELRKYWKDVSVDMMSDEERSREK